jgi:hypothetical protein
LNRGSQTVLMAASAHAIQGRCIIASRRRIRRRGCPDRDAGAGVDFHPEFQQIASVDTETGECQEKRLAHRDEAEKFYRALAPQKVRVGMEASGHARWFERLVAELQ